MIEAYSKNVVVAANSGVPLNSVAIQKGCTAIKNGVNTIELNKCGVYMVAVNASAIASVAGDITLQLTREGVIQPQAFARVTAADTTSTYELSFVTLVQVKDNNSCRCCDDGTSIEVVNTGVSATFSHVDVVVTKIC